MSADPWPPRTSNFSSLLGIKDVETSADRVVNRMLVADALANRNGVLHGGALMSLIDHTAGTLALLGAPGSMTTVTVEAKTNFFRSVHVGGTVTAVGTPLHVGRTTLVVQVLTHRDDGQRLSATSQTQLFVTWDS